MYLEKKKKKRYLAISLGLHLGLFLFFTIGDFIFPNNPALFTPTVQIDMVALPDKVKSDDNTVDTSLPVKEDPPPAPEPKEEPKEEEIAPPAPKKPEPEAVPLKQDKKKPKEAEKQAKSAIEKMREQLKKEREEAERKKQEALEKRKADLKNFEEKYRSAIKGNQKNEGTSATGALEATLNAYAGHIADELRRNWGLPAYLQGKGLRAVVRIYIDGRGTVARYQFMQTSGNDIFDEAVKRTVQESKFAPPPEEMAKRLRNSGLEVLFPL